VYDAFEENDTAYMVMEFLEGQTLAQELEQRGGCLPEAELIGLARVVADSLETMHAQGVLHHDIKPDNVMVVRGGPAGAGVPRVVLIDFGAAGVFLGDGPIRQSLVVTPGYAPLEQYARQARRGPFTDVYALAATLYHLATGVQAPSATDRAAGVLLKSPREINPALSRAFDRAVLHALEMRVDRRPQSARDFFSELAEGGRTAAAVRPARTPLVLRVGQDQTRPSGLATLSAARAEHLRRAVELLSSFEAGGAATPAHDGSLTCPVCRGATLADPARADGAIPCPFCRAGEIRARLSLDAGDRCPGCRTGRLNALTSDALARCPVCIVGRVRCLPRRAREDGGSWRGLHRACRDQGGGP
jgi:hypothetical protein